jgi:FdhD protein
MNEFIVAPDPLDPRLTRTVSGIDQTGAAVETKVPVERPLTLYLNGQEIVTMMTIGDHPEDLALGYLLNQNMLRPGDLTRADAGDVTRADADDLTRADADDVTRADADDVSGIDFDDDLGVVVVRTAHRTNFEEKLKKKTLTSGCAQGTAFGDVMERFDRVRLDPDAVIRTSWLYALSRKINTRPSLYLEAGAIHGCVLCEADRPLLYMEDVGRHNAIDKIAGYMYRNAIPAAGKMLYTTGRLTSEMVIKTVQMEIPVLVSRSGFTASGVDLARQAGLTLIGRAKGSRFVVLAGAERLRFDAPVPEGSTGERRSRGDGAREREASDD